jgi:hypothetical protein
VTRTAVSTDRLDKHVSAETNSRNKNVMLSVWSVPRGYKKDKEGRVIQLSFEKPVCQDMSLVAEELN